MNVYVAVTKHLSDRYAGAMIYFLSDADIWHYTLYANVRGKIGPISSLPCPTLEEAFREANEFLKTDQDDWHEMSDDDAEQYLLDHVRQRENS